MSNIIELIRKKRDGEELSKEEIERFISLVVDGKAQDSQIGAMLMAMFLQNLTDTETMFLTAAMVTSGDVFTWDEAWAPLLADKHSTGGVGDKVSLVLAPALAALGFKVPMVSGRGLEFTGGTLDKMESIPGYRVRLTKEEMHNALSRAGCFIASAGGRLTPADLVLYKTRDITATVNSTALTAASITCKKVAEGARTLIMDIKVGRAAFFTDLEDARDLANKIISVSAGLGLRTRAIISKMDSPLGHAVGNALEVAESVDCLRGGGPADLLDITATLGGMLLLMNSKVESLDEGKAATLSVLKSGAAMQCFEVMLQCHGVDVSVARELCRGDMWKILPAASHKTYLIAEATGVVGDVDAKDIAVACWHLGAGRSHSEQPVDHSVGVVLLVKPGDAIKAGQKWLEVHHSQEKLDAQIQERLRKAIVISTKVRKVESLVIEMI